MGATHISTYSPFAIYSFNFGSHGKHSEYPSYSLATVIIFLCTGDVFIIHHSLLDHALVKLHVCIRYLLVPTTVHRSTHITAAIMPGPSNEDI